MKPEDLTAICNRFLIEPQMRHFLNWAALYWIQHEDDGKRGQLCSALVMVGKHYELDEISAMAYQRGFTAALESAMLIYRSGSRADA